MLDLDAEINKAVLGSTRVFGIWFCKVWKTCSTAHWVSGLVVFFSLSFLVQLSIHLNRLFMPFMRKTTDFPGHTTRKMGRVSLKLSKESTPKHLLRFSPVTCTLCTYMYCSSMYNGHVCTEQHMLIGNMHLIKGGRAWREAYVEGCVSCLWRLQSNASSYWSYHSTRSDEGLNSYCTINHISLALLVSWSGL